MSNIMAFPKPAPPQLCKTRNRDQVLNILLPKFLGVLWRGAPCPKGPPDQNDDRLRVGGAVVQIEKDFAIGGDALPGAGYSLYAYFRQAGLDWVKVFSVQVADRPFTESRFDYWGGRCAILSWKRGPWEDRLCAEPDEPRSLAHVHTVGLSRCIAC